MSSATRKRYAAHATSAVVVALTLAWVLAIFRAPADALQGVIQKTLYIHPPLAFGAYLGFFGTALCGALYLWKRDARFDRMAQASAETGVVICTLALLTGTIWAKGTWGRWWTWDLRLTITLLLYFVYAAYLLLRAFSEGSERGARFAAVYGILGLAIVPLNRAAITLAGGRALHPANLNPGDGNLAPGMSAPFLLGTLWVFACFAWLALRRYELAHLREAALALDAEREAEDAWAT